MAHRKFEAVMSAPTVQKVAKATRDYISKGVNLLETSGDLTYEANGTIWKTVPGDASRREEVKAAPPGPMFHGTPVDEVPAAGRKPDAWAKLAKEMANSKEVNPWALRETIPVLVNLDGIKQVTVDEVGVISSIDLSTGSRFRERTRRP
jgi:hypothetical protein